MGAWGVGPFSNDRACDWRDNKLADSIKEAVLGDNIDEAFAALAAVDLLNLEFDYEEGELEAAFQRIEAHDLKAGWKKLGERQGAVGELKARLLESYK